MSQSGNIQSQLNSLSGHYLDLFTKVKYDDLYAEPRVTVDSKNLMLKVARGRLAGSAPGNPNTKNQWPNAESREAIATAIVLNHTESERQRLTGFFLEKYPDQTDWLCDAFLWLTPYLGFPSVMSALASIPQARKGGQKVAPYTYQSPALQKLYGITVAGKVAARLNEISPSFNRLCQHIAYDEIWGHNEESYPKKSLMTIATLILLELEEQLAIHLNGLANLGGDVETVRVLCEQMTQAGFAASNERVERAIQRSTLGNGNRSTIQSFFEITKDVVATLVFCRTRSFPLPMPIDESLFRQLVTYAGLLRLKLLSD